MAQTFDPTIDSLLEWLRARLQQILATKLVGLYLYGSLVAGDFDPERSDIDLLAALAEEMTDQEFEQLRTMHADLTQRYPQWDNRIEVAYLSLDALQSYKTHASAIAIVSPGEPFHRKQAGREFLLNWFMVRESGKTLLGPPPAQIIAPSTRQEFLQVVGEHIGAWRGWIAEMRTLPAQAYAILTLCRGLYALTHGEQVSKQRAAKWAAHAFPEWAPLIENAVQWREGRISGAPGEQEAYRDTLRFVAFAFEVGRSTMTQAPRMRLSAAVLDAPNARALAGFYERLLGWTRVADEPGWVMLRPPSGGTGLSFQSEPNFTPPVWPSVVGKQQMMLHLDIAVEDLEAGVAWALAAGAQLAEFQPQAHVRVLLDPAGHPFCLFQGPV